MPVIIASSIKEAKELINGGKYREIVLNFDIDADDFFLSPAIPPEQNLHHRQKRSLSGKAEK
jgi:hypothetical protein